MDMKRALGGAVALGVVAKCLCHCLSRRPPTPVGELRDVVFEGNAVDERGKLYIVRLGPPSTGLELRRHPRSGKPPVYVPWEDFLCVHQKAPLEVEVQSLCGEGSAERVVAVHLGFCSQAGCEEFLQAVRRLVFPCDPYTVHVFVNPRAGVGKGAKQLEQVILPILDASPHSTVVKYTTAPGHAEALAADCPGLRRGDVIAVVGGDGTLHEVINGLDRNEEIGLSEVSLAVIPSGSGNGIATSIGITSVRRAVMAVVRGKTQPIDVFELTIDRVNYRRLGVLSVTYAAIADIDIGSEFMRCCGDVRFTLYALWVILAKRVYPLSLEARLAGTPPPTGVLTPTPSGGVSLAAPAVTYFLLTNASHISESST
eukprot:Sspe_Gene.105830::Locus_82948_Transcript_1_1_Confidence_1.000_Length_1157::g.105830::m.105830/K04718/SPHK; sphingosine kinase